MCAYAGSRPRVAYSSFRAASRSGRSSNRAGSRQQLAAASEKGPVIVIDNYDSFTYNLCQYLGELGADFVVYKNDEKTVDEIRAMNPAGILVSPGPGMQECMFEALRVQAVAVAAVVSAEAKGAMQLGRGLLGNCTG